MPADESPEPAVPARRSTPTGKRLLRGAVTLIVLVLIFGFVFPQLADFATVADLIGEVSVAAWIILGALAVLFLVAYVFVLMGTIRTLRFREGFVAQTAGTAVTNSLPAGGALSIGLQYAMYLSWGFSPETITAGLLAAGVWDQLGRLALPVLAIGAVALVEEVPGWMWVAAGVGLTLMAGTIVLLTLLFRYEPVARAVGRLGDRVVGWFTRRLGREAVDVTAAVLRFRETVVAVVRTRWLRVTAATIVNHAAMAGLFVASIRAVGIGADDISTASILLAFSVGRLLVAIPVTPGGLGIVDLAYVGLLELGWGDGATEEPIVAGVLLFRALTFLPAIPVGAGSWVFWRANTSWHRYWRTERRGEELPPGAGSGDHDAARKGAPSSEERSSEMTNPGEE